MYVTKKQTNGVQVVPVLAAVQEKGEAARLLARYNVSKDAAYSAHARKKGDRAQVQVRLKTYLTVDLHERDDLYGHMSSTVVRLRA